ncbi:HAD family phosphatase [Rhodoferax sp. AJA081-3]|uniref:HAD family hydrolase n=1 Tax=Rhodoferax sp. AJA081-3 TaxID=2752316 RepID=UPI001AE0CB4A|nr:HAD family phosphatase [Rhodoferax sp. AJA081-3]QTN30042.1 HAD family phosphatase [Rhodoferax sp. AJA081-3]
MNFVFDFGAVLFTWKPADLMAQTFPERAGTPEAAAELAHAMFAHADWNSFDQGTLEMDALVGRTSERLDLDAAVLHELVAHIGERLQPIPETVALLERLHSLRDQHPALRLYFLSNMPRPYARALERRHAFLQWFDGGIFSSDVLHIKPDPTIYQLLQSRYALEPTHTLFIDDLLANVLAAQGQGWHAVQFESAPQLQTHVAARFGYL